MMLTAKAEETDQLIGFSVGADDYVVKPFSVRVVLERVKSLLRRNERTKNGGSDIVTSGGIEIDRLKHRVSVHGQPIDLTPSEFRLLDTLIRNPGRAFDRSELIELALGGDTLVLERTIDVHIRSLRKKIGDLADSSKLSAAWVTGSAKQQAVKILLIKEIVQGVASLRCPCV